MDAARAASTAAIVACLAVLALLFAPYLLFDQASAVTAYYNAGLGTPFATLLLAVVGVIVFAAGREERSDPALVAGAGLVFGLFVFATAGAWAVTVPGSVAVQLGDVGRATTFVEYHRYLVTLAAAGVFFAGAWYARALRLL